MKEWMLRHVVRVSAVVAAVAPVLAASLDAMQWEAAGALSAVVLTAGEVAQRVEDSKTLRAYLAEPSRK